VKSVFVNSKNTTHFNIMYNNNNNNNNNIMYNNIIIGFFFTRSFLNNFYLNLQRLKKICEKNFNGFNSEEE
jgi:hypothetical protein